MIVSQMKEYSKSSMHSLHNQISKDQKYDSCDGEDPITTGGIANTSCHTNHLLISKLSLSHFTPLCHSSTSITSSDTSSCSSTTRGRRRFRKSKPIEPRVLHQHMYHMPQVIILNISEVLAIYNDASQQPFPADDRSLSSVSGCSG